MFPPALLQESTWKNRARSYGWEWIDAEGIWGLHRPSPKGSRRLYLSAGIHGDEPAGPIAVHELLACTALWEGWEVYVFPVLNPGGLRLGTRHSASGIDLNRDYADPLTPEVATHVRCLKKMPPFDVTVCLHEDWEAVGVYLYYLHRDPGIERAWRVLAAMGEVIPVEPSSFIDGREADRGLIHRNPEEFEGGDWPEAIYLGKHHTDHGFTLETPSAAPLEKRVEAHCRAVECLVSEWSPVQEH